MPRPRRWRYASRSCGSVLPRAHECAGDLAVGLAVEGQADVAAGDLDVAGVGHDAGAPAHDAVALGVDGGELDRLREVAGVVAREGAAAGVGEAAVARDAVARDGVELAEGGYDRPGRHRDVE